MQRRRSIAAGLGLLAVLMASPMVSVRSAIAADSPPEVVRRLTDAVIAVIKNQDLSADARTTTIVEIVYSYIDFATLSRLVLAKNWKDLDTTQREHFVEEFKKYLAIRYGRNVVSYGNETVQILGDRDQGRGDWSVRTKNLSGAAGNHVLVEYRLRQNDGEWKVIDVLVEGVSLVSSYRSQFQVLISQGGVDHLLEVLRKKNT